MTLFGETPTNTESPLPYQNFQSASDSNWQLAKDLFSDKENPKLLNPSSMFKRNNVCFDALLVGKKSIVLLEIKRRLATFEEIEQRWNGEIFLEKSKWNAMNKMLIKLKKNHPDKTLKLHYMNKSSDGMLMIWDITNKPEKWTRKLMNNKTYHKDGVGGDKVWKEVAMLKVTDATLKKTNIFN